MHLSSLVDHCRKFSWILNSLSTMAIRRKKKIKYIVGTITVAWVLYYMTLHLESFCWNCKEYPNVSDISKLSFLTPIHPNHNYIKPFVFKINPFSCSFTASIKTPILIAVKSASGNVEMRNFIRFTWGCRLPINMKLIFLLGDNDFSSESVKSEAQKHNDILQMNFRDTYHNNTLKLVMGLEYFSKKCASFHYLVFMDDDIVADFFILNDHLKTLNTKTDVFEGFVVHNTVNRRKYFLNRYYIPWEYYPYKSWSPYLAGAMFVMSASVVNKVVNAYRNIPYYFLDDAWLGLVTKSLNIDPVDKKLYHFDGEFSHKSIVIESKHQQKDLILSLMLLQKRHNTMQL